MKYEKTLDVAHIYWSYNNFIELSKKLVKKLGLNSLSELIRFLITDACLKHDIINKEEHEILRAFAAGKAGANKRNK